MNTVQNLPKGRHIRPPCGSHGVPVAPGGTVRTVKSATGVEIARVRSAELFGRNGCRARCTTLSLEITGHH